MISRYRVEDVLAELGIEVLDEADGELVALCPGHKRRTGRADHRPSWSINYDTGEHHCFSCGFGGTLAGLVAAVRGGRASKAKTWLTRYATETLDMVHRLEVDAPIAPRPAVVPEYELGRFTAPPQWALEARQIAAEAANALGVLWDPHREAWVAPIRDPHTGELWGWQLKGQGSRLFRNLPPGVAKTEAVFGLQPVMHRCVLVESPLDAVRLHGLGITAVSSYGAAVSDTQMQLILEHIDVLIVALDNPYWDDAGRTNALRLLKDYGHLGIRFWPYTEDSPKDPGDMTDEQIVVGLRTSRHSVRGRRAVLDFA